MQCNRAVIAVTAVVLPCLWLAGCWAGPPEEWECTPSSDDKPCPGGKVCQVGEDGPVCRSVCKTSDDCDVSSEGCVDGACRPYAQSCDTSSECLPEFHCSAGVCRRREAIGVPCGTQSDACQSGHCVDGVCCDGPCDATCMTCVAGAGIGDGDDGLCHPVDAGLDPADDCEGVPACDGTGACFAKAQGEPCDESYECATSYCVDGYCCSSDCSGLCVACRADLTDDTNGVCSDIPGGKDPEEECAGTGTCTGSGYCTAGAANGMPCGMDDQCASNHCADGVCCATACNTACEACVERLTGTADGTCAPIPEPFDPDGDCLASGGFGCNGAGACNPEKTWSAAVRIEESSGTAAEPDVAVDGSGNAIAVWRQRTGAASTSFVVRTNRYTPGDNRWGVAEEIQTDTEEESGAPEVAVNASGNAVVAWGQGGSTYCSNRAVRYIVGHGWQSVDEVHSHCGHLDLAIDDRGNAFVVSDYYDGNEWHDLSANRFEVGVGWTGAVVVEHLDTGYASNPAVAVSAIGEALAAWRQSGNARAAHFTPGGDWEPWALSGRADQIAVDMNAAGDGFVVWGGQWTAASASYCKSGVCGPVAQLSSDEASGGKNPRVAVDSSGNAVAVWQQADQSGWSIWSNSFEVGNGWGGHTLVQTDSNATEPQVAVDAAGNAVLVWRQTDSSNHEIWANRKPTGGEWGTPVLIGPAYYDRARVGISPTGDAVVVWQHGGDIWAAVLR